MIARLNRRPHIETVRTISRVARKLSNTSRHSVSKMSGQLWKHSKQWRPKEFVDRSLDHVLCRKRGNFLVGKAKQVAQNVGVVLSIARRPTINRATDIGGSSAQLHGEFG